MTVLQGPARVQDRCPCGIIKALPLVSERKPLNPWISWEEGVFLIRGWSRGTHLVDASEETRVGAGPAGEARHGAGRGHRGHRASLLVRSQEEAAPGFLDAASERFSVRSDYKAHRPTSPPIQD